MLAKWQGPYIVTRKVGPVDYEVETPDKRQSKKIYHMNLLKQWKEREAEANLSEELGPQVPELKAEGLSPKIMNSLEDNRRESLRRIERRFHRVFSKTPGKTNVVKHSIKIKDKKVIRTHPHDAGQNT